MSLWNTIRLRIFFVVFPLFILPYFISSISSVSAASVNSSLTSTAGGDTLRTGLVGWWTFDGANLKTNVIDSSGQGNHGRLVGFGATSSAVIGGKMGQALKFDGVNDYVSVPDTGTSLDFNASSTYAWSSWIKFTGSTSGYKCYLSKDTPVKGGGFNLCINQTSNTADIIICKYLTGINWTCSSGLSLNIPINSWNNITVNYNGITGNWGIYKNGNLMGTINYYVANDLSAKYYIGSGNDGNGILQGPLYFWKGYIDDVRVYNRALSATEIKQLYNMGR